MIGVYIMFDEKAITGEDPGAFGFFEIISELETFEKYTVDKLLDCYLSGVDNYCLSGISPSTLIDDTLKKALFGVHIYGKDTICSGTINDELPEIIRALENIDIEEFKKGFIQEILKRKRVYPDIWESRDKLFDELLNEYNGLLCFYRKAVEKNAHIMFGVPATFCGYWSRAKRPLLRKAFRRSHDSVENRNIVPSVVPSKIAPVIWGTVIAGLKKSRILTFDYLGTWDEDYNNQQVRPYQVLFISGMWYLYGFSEKRNAIRIFSLSRIKYIVFTKDEFKPPQKNAYPNSSEGTHFGILIGQEKYTFSIEYYGEMEFFAAEPQWAGDQRITKIENGIEIEFNSTQYDKVLTWLLSCGCNAIPREPKKLVDEWELHIKEMNRLASQMRKSGESISRDAQLVNFREIRVGGIAPGRLYRSSHPIKDDKEEKTIAFLAAKTHIETVINLVEFDISEKAPAVPWYDHLYRNNRVMGNDMEVKRFSMEFKKNSSVFKIQVRRVFGYIISTEGPWLIHCHDGADLTGFFSLVLEALMGATLDEIIDDYLQSFRSVFFSGVYKHSKKTDSTAVMQLISIMGTDLPIIDRNLPLIAEYYLLNTIGLSTEEVNLLKEKLY